MGQQLILIQVNNYTFSGEHIFWGGLRYGSLKRGKKNPNPINQQTKKQNKTTKKTTTIEKQNSKQNQSTKTKTMQFIRIHATLTRCFEMLSWPKQDYFDEVC